MLWLFPDQLKAVFCKHFLTLFVWRAYLIIVSSWIIRTKNIRVLNFNNFWMANTMINSCKLFIWNFTNSRNLKASHVMVVGSNWGLFRTSKPCAFIRVSSHIPKQVSELFQLMGLYMLKQLLLMIKGLIYFKLIAWWVINSSMSKKMFAEYNLTPLNKQILHMYQQDVKQRNIVKRRYSMEVLCKRLYIRIVSPKSNIK